MNQSDAKAIVQQAWTQVYGSAPTDSQTAYTQAVAWFENQYGRAGQFAALAANGRYNWGSLHANGKPPDCPIGSAPGSDLGQVCFKVFRSDVDAAAAFIRELTQNTKYNRARVLAAMSGTPTDVAQAMYDSSYYQGAPGTTVPQKVAAYAAGIQRALTQIGAGAAVPNAAGGASNSANTLLSVALGAGAAYGAYWLFYKGGAEKTVSASRSLVKRSRRLA